ncbi:MAG: cation transporter [Bacteroidales bacterium]|jgi:cobalt-zinc-cadmium efflux system protein|nr:cation transporter [Bacteroidales bacterium]
MSHYHDHNHNHLENFQYNKVFAIGIGLNIAFVIVEVMYGFLANSSALLADAGHNASDVLSLIFAWTAVWLAKLKPKGKYTYGLRKTTILVSILNALLLFGAVAIIGWNAIEKISNPEPVAGSQVMIVAAIGVLINGFTAFLFIKGQKHDLNLKGAYLHMLADAIISLGVVVAGLLITFTGFMWIDPLTSMIIILVIIWSTWGLFIDSINLALDAVPRNIDIEKLQNELLKVEGVEQIHDLHVWAMSTTENAMTVHVISKNDGATIIENIQKIMRENFAITHTTIQVEDKEINKNCLLDC